MSLPRYTARPPIYANGYTFGVKPLADSFQQRRVTKIYPPTRDDLIDMRKNGVVVPVEKIVEVTDSNGTVKVALDENGTVVSTEKKGLTPLQMGMIAVGAFLLFGG